MEKNKYSTFWEEQNESATIGQILLCDTGEGNSMIANLHNVWSIITDYINSGYEFMELRHVDDNLWEVTHE
jgi:hypothetical protein